jgi:hypothetical protein
MAERRFTASDFRARRWLPGRMVGIVLTDRCPVGCAHCSVSALMEDAGPEVNPHLADQIGQLAARPEVEVIFITGGDPFVHLAELAEAVTAITTAGKRAVVHTSGYWGNDESISGQVRDVLTEADALVFGVDLFHRVGVADPTLISAFRQAAAADCWIAVQVIVGPKQPPHRSYAIAMLTAALGERWHRRAEIIENPPLHVGRAVRLRAFAASAAPAGRCDLVNRPILRFNGEVTACCNEAVLRGAGPAQLRRAVNTDIDTALAQLSADPLVSLIRKLPTGAAYDLVSRVAGRNPEPTSGKCDACWRTGELLAGLSPDDLRSIDMFSTLLTE